jgi:cytochrome c-type biogenesis protein CcmE
MEQAPESRPKSSGRLKFIIGGLLIIVAIAYLIISSTKANAQYFFTIDELKSRGQSVIGQNVRISGAVVGDTIQYDPQALALHFTIANVPADNKLIEAQGGLASVLHEAVIDPARTRLEIVYNGPKPDLLRDEAQAIMTGHIAEDGVFHADELLLKCPTKYEEAVPSQVVP